MIVALCIALILVGIGIVVGLVIIGCAAILIGLGIISSSTLIGLRKRRFAAGLRALNYQVCGTAGWLGGIVILWLGERLAALSIEPWEILLFGSLGGIAGGLSLAYALDRLTLFAWRKLREPESEKIPPGPPMDRIAIAELPRGEP